MRRVGCKGGKRSMARGSARCRRKGRVKRETNDLDRAWWILSAAALRGDGGGVESGLDWLHLQVQASPIFKTRRWALGAHPC